MVSPAPILAAVGSVSATAVAATLAQDPGSDVAQLINEWGVAGVVIAVAGYLLRENRKEGDTLNARHDTAIDAIERKHASAIAAMAQLHEAEVRRLRAEIDRLNERIDRLINR